MLVWSLPESTVDDIVFAEHVKAEGPMWGSLQPSPSTAEWRLGEARAAVAAIATQSAAGEAGLPMGFCPSVPRAPRQEPMAPAMETWAAADEELAGAAGPALGLDDTMAPKASPSSAQSFSQTRET